MDMAGEVVCSADGVSLADFYYRSLLFTELLINNTGLLSFFEEPDIFLAKLIKNERQYYYILILFLNFLRLLLQYFINRV